MTDNKRDFNKDAATWDDNPVRVKLAGDVAAAIADAIALTPDMDVLDFGCGTGLLTLALRPRVRSMTGVDTSHGMLDVLAAKIENGRIDNVATQLLDPEAGPILQGNYHLVVSSMTLHHVQEIQPLLLQFYRVLLPGGQLCIADLDPDEGQFHESPEGVFHPGFDRNQLAQALLNAGFQDIQQRTAATLTKPAHDGTLRTFTVFLVVGTKPRSK